VDIVGLADTTVVLLAPGMGDGVQAAKAGILEAADVFVVNKADRDGVDVLVRDLRYAVSLARQEVPEGAWRRPIVRTVASRGEGVDELVRVLGEHHDWLAAHGELARRRGMRAASEIEAIALRRIRSEFAGVHGAGLPALAERVVGRELDPYAAADELLATAQDRRSLPEV
jgi:LAO/AO transport system kinase